MTEADTALVPGGEPDRAAADPREASWVQFRAHAASTTRQRRPEVDERAIALTFALHRVAAEHQRRSEALLLRRHGLSYSGFRVLFMVWLVEPVQARELARHAGVSRQTTSTVLTTLEGAGLVARERSASGDRRVVSVRLTGAGRTLVAEALLAQNTLERRWFGVLTPGEQDELVALCDRILRRMRDGADEPDRPVGAIAQGADCATTRILRNEC